MRKRFWSLDILRFFAASLVMVCHLSWWSWVTPNSTPATVLRGAASFPAWEPFAWFGWVGVEIFFVISGFVIFYSAQDTAAFSFLRRRFLRLFPGALICATITALTLYALNLYELSEVAIRYLRSIIFWPRGPWVDGVYWTLSIEIAFYVLIFFSMFCSRRVSIEAIVVTVGSISSALWVFDLAYNGEQTGDLARIIPGTLENMLLLQHGMLFALGSLIYVGAVSKWTMRRVFFAGVFFVSGCLPILHEANSKIVEFDLPYSPAIPVIVWAISVAVIVLSAHFERSLNPYIMGPIGVIGRSTYPLYLLHDVVGAALLLGLIAVEIAPTISLLLSMLSMGLLSIIVCTMVEDRIRPMLDPRRIAAIFAARLGNSMRKPS